MPPVLLILCVRSMAEAVTHIDRLEQAVKADWSNLRAVRKLAAETRSDLRRRVSGFDSEDTSIVVFGSLARDEFTSGSDIDWTLLIDGSADPRHYDLTAKIRTEVRHVEAKQVGPEGMFSAMVFSHDLIHEIGGEDDTNRNTTRRLLLLLESRAVGREDAHRRVVRNILNRYLLEDRGFWKGSRYRVPRFLQNDCARYWRTMAVDFAYKLRKRSGQGWAIRNIKLRMSRKMIYVSGLLACFRCHFDHTPEQWKAMADGSDRQKQVVDYLGGVFQETPLEITAGVLLRFEHLHHAASEILGSYNEFLGILADPEERDHLEGLSEENAESDKLYQKARLLSHRFRDGLLDFFFDSKSGMDDLTKNYGVF